MAQVVRNKLTDLGREHASDRRKVNVVAASLEAPVADDEDGPTLLDVLADTGPDDAAADREHFGVDARVDLEAALAGLSPAQQRLCQLLGEEGLSIKVAAERLGIPRATLYEEIKRIRKVFADHGLGDYLAR